MRSLITTVMEVVGLLLIASAATVAVWQATGPALALLTAGACLLAESALIVRSAPKPKPEQETL